MNFYYGANRVLEGIVLRVLANHVTALIGLPGWW